MKIEWVFRPDQPSLQGTVEDLPDDLARIKVAEGLAKIARPEPEPAPEPAGQDAEPAPKKRVPAQRSTSQD